MYENIETVTKLEEDRCKVLMGDWNAVVGEAEQEREVGKFRLRVRNVKGDK